jgi:hypothetical protein
MEKRRETRYTMGQPVTVTILSGEQSTHAATVRNGSGSGIALEMPVPVPAGAALKILLEDSLLLGEAIYCAPEENGFLVGIFLEAKLSQLSRLAEILEAFAQDQPGTRLRA